MWYFRSPQIVFGPDALDHLSQLSGQRAFIVTDQTMVNLGFVETVTNKLSAAGIKSRVFSQVEAEPSLETVHRGAAAMSGYGPDWIVALGGGSPLDAAKAMWVLYENPELDILALNPFDPLTLRQKAKLIAISSTSGTGAETTWAIVLTDHTERRKVAIGSPENLPDIAIVDPALAIPMPPQLTADTGMDALVHAIEGYTSTWYNDFSDGLCLQAVRLIFDYLPAAVENGQNREAREKMHNAAAIAGLGFINSMCALAHALGHSLGAVYGLPHGRAVGLFLPYTIQFNVQGNAPTRYRGIAQFLGLPASTEQQAAAELVQAIRQLAQTIGQPSTLRQALNISRAALETGLEELVERAEMDSQILTTARPPETEDIQKLFLYAYEGRDVDW